MYDIRFRIEIESFPIGKRIEFDVIAGTPNDFDEITWRNIAKEALDKITEALRRKGWIHGNNNPNAFGEKDLIDRQAAHDWEKK